MAKLHGSYSPDFTYGNFQKADGHIDIDVYCEAEEKWIEDLKARLRKLSKGDLVGEELHFPVADGHARYVVVKERPFTVGHLAVGDAWQVGAPTIRGLRLEDARAFVEADRKFKAAVEKQRHEINKFYEDHLGKTVHYHNAFGQFVRCEVVRAGADSSFRGGIKKGEACLKPVALVGNWPEYELSGEGWSYHVESIKEGKLLRPHISNVYEACEDLQKRFPEIPKAAPCVIKGQQELFGE